MKVTIFLAILLFVGLVHSATRLGVYSSSDCAEANMIGYLWLPYPKYTYKNIAVTSCTASFDGQYYDVKTDLAEETQADRRNDWVYWYNSNIGDIGTCDGMNETSVMIYGATPGTCLNYGPFVINQANTEESLLINSCGGEASAVLLNLANWGCNSTQTYPVPTTCTESADSGSLDKVVCDGVTGTPTADTPSNSAPSGSTPVASTPSSTPKSTAPTANTPSKKASSASLISASLALSALVILL